ncbi:hypothetical protein [Modestobacter italicus]|uniref:hypothetical protein n=1 Tax=Modestobacter italicus (strain DSM 44449 / CECT 9708 / BC 501) TaxID=2732864 RepID=UPI001C95F649|nr:hypothetical protein [Modestobacter italicus]
MLPFVEELVRRLRMDGSAVDVRYGGNRSVQIRLGAPRVDHDVTLWTREPDLEAAVTALGEDCRDVLWPDHTVESAGFNLLLVHLDEVIATCGTTAPLRITAAGLQWPE